MQPQISTNHSFVFRIVGPGEGSLRELDGHWDMELTGTTRATTVIIIGAFALEQINADSMVGAIYAPQTDFEAVATTRARQP